MPTNISAVPAAVRAPRIAFPLAALPFVLVVALGLCRFAMSLRYPDIAAAMADIVGP